MAFNFQNLGSAIRGALYPRSGGAGNWWNLTYVMAPGSKYDYQAEAGDLWGNSVIAIAIKWLGDRFPGPRLQVSRIAVKGDYIPISKTPIEALWERPNPYYTRRTLEKAIGLSLVCDGNAYIQKIRDGREKLAELWWLPHTAVAPQWSGDDFITNYRVSIPGEPDRFIDPRDMVHIRDGIDPTNPRLGLSAVKAQIREICTVNEESGYTAAILRNSGVPSLVVSPDDPGLRPNEKDSQSIKDRIRETTTKENRGMPIVLQGKYKVTPVGFSPEQLALDKLPVAAISRIAAAIGVAPMSLGLPDAGKTYANYPEANRASWNTIMATQCLVAEAIRYDILPEYGYDPAGYFVGYDYSDIKDLQESLDAVHKRTRDDFLANLLTQSAAQELLGYDVDPEGDRYFFEIQTAMAQASMPATPDAEGAANAQPPEYTPTNGKRWH
jgi:HK97 family phage portal protein